MSDKKVKFDGSNDDSSKKFKFLTKSRISRRFQRGTALADTTSDEQTIGDGVDGGKRATSSRGANVDGGKVDFFVFSKNFYFHLYSIILFSFYENICRLLVVQQLLLALNLFVHCRSKTTLNCLAFFKLNCLQKTPKNCIQSRVY